VGIESNHQGWFDEKAITMIWMTIVMNRGSRTNKHQKGKDHKCGKSGVGHHGDH
jgi:hypothetical protein